MINNIGADMLREIFKKNSLMTRIAVGKLIGLAFGLVGFVMLPHYVQEVSLTFRLGMLFWYVTLGAIIGVFGVFTWHPIFKFLIPWWVRAPFLGGWMNFVLSLVAYDELAVIMHAIFGYDGMISSPFWFVLEGVVIGAIMGFFATKIGGEGSEIVDTGF